MIESALGKLIPITLGFLAQFIGLGGITKKIIGIIKKVKKPVDTALDKAVGFITKKIKATPIYKAVVKGLNKVDGAKKKVNDAKDKIKQKAADMESKLDKKIVAKREHRIKKTKDSKEAKKKQREETDRKKAQERAKKEAEKKKKKLEKEKKNKKLKKPRAWWKDKTVFTNKGGHKHCQFPH